jgi:predicted DNA-binding transcriptional regulator AlpA
MASPGVEIAGTTYLPAVELAKQIGVSRTTLWRWRHEGKIPLGRRYRNGLVLFSQTEVEMVQSYADRLEPISADGVHRPPRQRTSGRR